MVNLSGNTAVITDILVVLGLCGIFVLILYGIVILSRLLNRMMEKRLEIAWQKRRNINDDGNFRRQYGYSWDILMTFKVYSEEDRISQRQSRYNMQHILRHISSGGLEFKLFYSANNQLVFCKIRCPLPRLRQYCSSIQYKLLLDSNILREQCLQGRELLWEPLKIPEVNAMTTLNPYVHIYCQFEEKYPHLYKQWPKSDQASEKYVPVLTSSVRATTNPLTSNQFSLLNSPSSESNIDGFESDTTLFRGVDRLKLINSIINSSTIGCCGLDIGRLLQDECLVSYTALPDVIEATKLSIQWLQFFQMPWNQPTEEVRNYFGEKVALYFKWLGLYTSWLLLSSVVGTFLWISIAVRGNDPNAPVLPYFAVFMALWSAMVLKHWLRTEKTTSMEWGMVGSEEEENVRPQFRGDKKISAVTGKVSLHYSPWRRAVTGVKTQGIVLALILVVLGIIACIFVIKLVINASKTVDYQFSGVLTSMMLAALILVLHDPFEELAIKLNDRENHRTNTEYEDALISKVFLFGFFNSYSALFYIAFLQPFMPIADTCQGGCMVQLQVTLATIFIGRLFVNNIKACAIPMILKYYQSKATNTTTATVSSSTSSESSEVTPRKDASYVDINKVYGANSPEKKDENGKVNYGVSEVEMYFYMPEYHDMLGIMDDYAETVFQFGYSTMFATAFPLSCLMALVNNYVEMRVDAWKLLQLYRRPMPRNVEDIGTWYPILEIISIASIFVNSGIIAFTSATLINYTWTVRVWIFILLSAALLCIRLSVGYVLPDTPDEVKCQLERQEYIVSKVLHNVEDEDDSDLVKGIFRPPNYLVNSTDEDPL